MSRVYWDTMLFIYWLEGNPQFAKRVGDIYKRMGERRVHLLTGCFTFGEVLAAVYRRGFADRAIERQRQLQQVVHEVVDFHIETADSVRQIRGSLGLPPADAQAGTDLFLTNDKRLVGKFIPGIQFVASLEEDIL